MKKYYHFTIFFLLFFFFLLNVTFEVDAYIYRIINSRGITVRVTTEPILTEQETEDECKIYLLEPGKRLEDIDRDNKIRGIVFSDINENGRREKGEQGIASIQVSNGLDITETDSQGYFELEKEGTFIFLTKPNDFSITTSWYRIISDYNMSFGLTEDKGENSGDFTFIHFTDPHTTLDKDYNEIMGNAVNEINDIEPDFIVVTGDMVFEGDKTSIEKARRWFNRYVSLIDKLYMPVFHTMGNHDVAGIFYQEDMRNQIGYDKWLYYSYFGPSFYSFNWGNFHCIVLDPHQFDKGTQYFELSEKQILWLKQDLSFYREDTPLLVFFHEPLNSWTNKDEIIHLFGNRKVRLFSGHWHFDVLLEHQGEDVFEQVTGSLCGGWWKENCADGRSGGYRIYQVNKDDVNSFYREISQERQIELIEPEPISFEPIDVTAFIYTEYSPLINAEYQIDQGEWITMKIEHQNYWFAANGSTDFIDFKDPGYHQITIKAEDQKGYFDKTINIKISPEESLAFQELYSNFSNYQGHSVKVEGKLKGLFFDRQYESHSREVVNGIMILEDQTGEGVIMLAEYGILKEEKLEKGQYVTAEVVPLLFRWSSISRKQKLMILFTLFRLPKNFLVTEKLFKPEAVKILWLTNLQ